MSGVNIASALAANAFHFVRIIDFLDWLNNENVAMACVHSCSVAFS